MSSQNIVNATMQGVPADLADTFRHVLGDASVKTLRTLWTGAEPTGVVDHLRTQFLRGLVYGLPAVAEKVIDPDSVGVPEVLQQRRIWNVFYTNSHACGIAATILWLYALTKDTRPGARRIAQATISNYLTFVTAVSYEATEAYARLVASEPESVLETRESQTERFNVLVGQIDSCFELPDRKKAAGGVDVLVESLLMVREKREERSPMTLDIKLPLSCSWELLQNRASLTEDSSLTKADILAKQDLLKSLPEKSIDEIVEELRKAGRYVGRGVCLLCLRDTDVSPAKGLFAKSRIWPDHADAPLSRLYGLSWDLPRDIDEPNVRLVLLGNSTISMFVQGDPFFEYLLGNWSYVDLAGKSNLLATAVGKKKTDVDDLRPMLYRLARFAYQLAYHNHGSTIDVNFVDPTEQRKKLQDVQERWDLDEIEQAGLPLPPSRKTGEPDVQESRRKMGRLAYALTLQDGLSIWRLSEDGRDIHLHDFGRYVDVEDADIIPTWPGKAAEMGLDPSKIIDGGRHRAAYSQSLWTGSRKKIVFCVSQDGYIQVFVDGLILPLR